MLHAPAHLDLEVLSALGRLHRSGLLSADQVVDRLDRLASADIERHAVGPLMGGAWRRRDQHQLADGLYVELAVKLGCLVLTTDRRLASATSVAVLVDASVLGGGRPARVILAGDARAGGASTLASVLVPAVEVLRAGGLVAFPTETVYGLGADALDPAAVARIFAAKGRPADNPVIVHAPDPETAWRVTTGPTALAVRLAERFWPGPLTLVLSAAAGVPTEVTAGLASVAVRVPDHPVALALLHAAGVPVAAPSANRSGRPSPTTAAHVLADLGDVVDMVVDGGPCSVGVESTVVDVRGGAPIVLREGAITREMLAEAVADMVTSVTRAAGVPDDVPSDLAASPGTRHRHYAPSCRVTIASTDDVPSVAASLAGDPARRVGLVARVAAPDGVADIARFADATDLAARLYQALRDAEAAGVTDLVVEAVPEVGIGRAVMDRLRRAAQGSAE